MIIGILKEITNYFLPPPLEMSRLMIFITVSNCPIPANSIAGHISVKLGESR